MQITLCKLGYGGTKSEMERLVKDAAKLDKSIDANSLSYGNIVKAIHAVQMNMGIYGTTQKEAEHTVTGSLNSMKSAWGNLLIAIGSGENLDQCFDNMISTVEIFFDNIVPVAERALEGFGTVIEKLAPKIAEKLPELADKLLPPLIKSSITLVNGLIKALPNIIKTVAVTIVDIFGEQFPIIGKIGDFFTKNSGKIAKSIKSIIPAVLALAIAFKGFKALKSITSIFGGKSSKRKSSGGIFGNLTKTLTTLAKTKPTTILKGMANLAIIMGGFTLLTAAMMAIAPFMAQLTDLKSFIKVTVAIGVLGVLGTGLAKLSEIVGKISVATVVKALANMAIMIAGMSALFLLVGAVSLLNFNYKKILQIALIIGVLGIVGTALSVFAGIVGLIPVPTVALGLANMAIVIAGMDALFLLIAATSLLNFDFGKITQIIGIIGLLGTVGAVLTVFAGIVGVIPIPVVLTGLANIALVIGGLTALIVAFGALSEIKGFNEFITTGGATLAKLFNIIGNIAGSLIGGIGEGISNSLPKIGENISKFATSIKPMFDMFKGADVSGIGTFFSALGSFMLQMAGNNILSFFTGGTDFGKLGTELNTFATNSKGFFITVANLPDKGFVNAAKLFDCLGGVKNLPKEGGMVSWFTGNISYDALTNGLGQLSSEKVVKFFNMVANLKQISFDNAKKLFDTLGNVSSLPKEGGVFQWFTGDISYGSLVNGLGQLASEKVKSFFDMVSTLKPIAFENTKKLFSALAKIGDLPKSGGIAQWFTGDNDLGTLGNKLKTFGENAESFFKQVNNLNISNLNGLWDSLKKSKSITADSVAKVDKNISDIVEKVKELPEKMGDGIRKSGQSLSDAVVSIWKDAVKASVAPVNKLLSGANHILKEFGSEKRVISWQPYAKGTNGHKGGNALVNDGRGAELVQMPNGNTFIPKGRNVFIPNAPKGMKVLSAERTAQVMGKKSATFNYANGIGDIDIWSYIDNANGLTSKIADTINYDKLSGFKLNTSQGMVKTFTGAMTSWVKKLFEEEGGKSLASYVASKGVEQWKSTVVRALKMEGQYSEANVKRTLFQMQTESGGNPRAINLWDSNAKKGTPSKGLMQVIDPTFKAYARKGFDKNIYDPLSNILASIRYAVSRYGSLAKAYRGVGYANGGFANKPSIFGENGLEAAIPLSKDKRQRGLSLWAKTGEMLGLSSYTPESDGDYYNSNSVEYNTYSPQFSFTISGTSDDRSLARKVKRYVKEAFEETLDEIETKNPKLQEV